MRDATGSSRFCLALPVDGAAGPACTVVSSVKVDAEKRDALQASKTPKETRQPGRHHHNHQTTTTSPPLYLYVSMNKPPQRQQRQHLENIVYHTLGRPRNSAALEDL